MKQHWTGLIVGAFVLASPWLLGFSNITLARWGNVICGLILILVNIWVIYGDPEEPSSTPNTAPVRVPRVRKSKNNKSRETL